MSTPNRSSRRALTFVALGSGVILAVGLTSFRLVGPEDTTFDDVARVVLQPTDDARSDDFVGNLDPAARHDSDDVDGDDADGDDADGDNPDGDGSDGGEDGDDEESTQTPVEIAQRIAILEPFSGATSVTLTTLSGRQSSGTEPGLYSANRRSPTCDVDALQEFLDGEANAARVDAWAGILGIEPDEPEGSGDESGDESDGADDTDESDEAAVPTVSDYVDGLTPVRLRMDTRVTSHGFADGQTTRFQSILQSGTPVLVDGTGVPRVACNSGNPLSDPDPLGDLDEEQAFELDAIAADPEVAWLGFDPAEVVTVVPGPEPIDEFTLIDIDDGRRLERPAGTNGNRDFGEGDFEATLEWDSPADLDLEVVEPNGTRIYQESPAPASSNGELDGDANSRCDEPASGKETISWPDGDAPSGDYEIIVRGFAVGDGYTHDCGGNTAEYTLTIRIFGQEDQVHEGSLGDGEADEHSATVS
jgi:hypothetical protein